MSQPITMDQAGRIVLPKEVRQRSSLELPPEPQADAELAPSAGKRMVLRPTGKGFDAAAATRAERKARPRRGSRG